jgi:pyruvate dehydrogenase (quinone)
MQWNVEPDRLGADDVPRPPAIRLRTRADRLCRGGRCNGGRGFTISTFDEIERVLDEAFAVEGPVIIQANVDRYEPMMPPKMPKDYAANFKKALPETSGHQRIEENIAREPLLTMMRGGENAETDRD